MVPGLPAPPIRWRHPHPPRSQSPIGRPLRSPPRHCRWHRPNPSNGLRSCFLRASWRSSCRICCLPTTSPHDRGHRSVVAAPGGKLDEGAQCAPASSLESPTTEVWFVQLSAASGNPTAKEPHGHGVASGARPGEVHLSDLKRRSPRRRRAARPPQRRTLPQRESSQSISPGRPVLISLNRNCRIWESRVVKWTPYHRRESSRGTTRRTTAAAP